MCVLNMWLEAYTELDKQGKVHRRIGDFATAAGSCPTGHPATILVGLYRFTSIGCRLVLFPIFQELTKDILQAG
jgi:hypothetical protein